MQEQVQEEFLIMLDHCCGVDGVRWEEVNVWVGRFFGEGRDINKLYKKMPNLRRRIGD